MQWAEKHKQEKRVDAALYPSSVDTVTQELF